MIIFELYIYFPESFSLNKILKLLRDPAFSGMRPELDYQESEEGFGVYALKSEKERGAGWGLEDHQEAGRQIFGDVKDNLEAIYALSDLETFLRSTLVNPRAFQ